MQKGQERVDRQVIPADTMVSLANVQGDKLELMAVCNAKESSSEAVFGLLVRCSEDGSISLHLFVDRSSVELFANNSTEDDNESDISEGG